MTILFDTNIVLDVLLKRDPFHVQSAKLMAMVETGQISGLLCATSVTTIHYLIEKATGKDNAIKMIDDLLSIFEIAPVDKSILQSTLFKNGRDFEDSVILSSAEAVHAEAIVTRNAKDFSQSLLPVYLPDEMLVNIKKG